MLVILRLLQFFSFSYIYKKRDYLTSYLNVTKESFNSFENGTILEEEKKRGKKRIWRRMDWSEQIHPISRWKVFIITDSRDQLAFHIVDKRFNVIIMGFPWSESTVGLHLCTTIQRFEIGADFVHWIASEEALNRLLENNRNRR